MALREHFIRQPGQYEGFNFPNGAVDYPVGPNPWDQAPVAMPQGSTLDADIEAQIQALSRPNPVVDQPVPKKSKLWQKVLSAIADAGSAYATGRPGGYTANLLGSDAAAADIEAGNLERRTRAGIEGKTRGAELRLQNLMSKREAADRAKAKREEQDYLETKAKEAAAAKLIEEKQRTDAEAALDLKNKMREYRFRGAAIGANLTEGMSEDQMLKEIARAEVASRKAPDDPESKVTASDKKDFQEEIGLLELAVSGDKQNNVPGLQEQLEAGTATPEEVERTLENRIRFSTLPDPLKKKYAEAIKHYLGPILSQHAMNKALAEGSPTDERPPSDPGARFKALLRFAGK